MQTRTKESKYKYVIMQIYVANGGSVIKNPLVNTGDTSSIPGSGRSPGGGKGYPLHFACLGNPTNRGAWQAAVHGVAKGWT